jgi:vacuolar-type H+-ATPase subunit D/Vma8
MDAEIKQHLVLLYQAVRTLQAQTNKLTVSVRALVEATTRGNSEFHDKYAEAFEAQALHASTEEHALALEQIDAAIQAMLADQIGQA